MRESSASGPLRVGCCGFAGARGSYFQEFPVVEVQQTFYKPPRLETARRWREEAPEGFQFTLKAWQLITHHGSSPTYRKAGLLLAPGTEEEYGFFRPTDPVRRAWQVTLEVAAALRATAVVFQCPARFRPTPQNLENMRRFFEPLRGAPYLVVWEPRGPEWHRETVASLCRELGLTHCVDPLAGTPVTGPHHYLRLHGGPGYRHRYTDAELAHLAQRWGTQSGYLMFNNLTMRQDAARFRELLVHAGTKG